MKWCCYGFQGNCENAGKRGLGIFAEATGDEPRFVLQYRACEGEFQGTLEKEMIYVLDTIISFCPWCGQRLKEAYDKNIEKIVRDDLRITY